MLRMVESLIYKVISFFQVVVERCSDLIDIFLLLGNQLHKTVLASNFDVVGL